MLIEHSETFSIRQSDFDCNDKIKVSSILDFFQTVATNHAENAGLGYINLLEQKLLWMVVKVKFEIVCTLKPGDKITVRTFPHPKGKIDFVRDYFIYDEYGKLCIIGSSQWVQVDAEKRRIVRPSGDFDGKFVPESEYAFGGDKIKKPRSTSATALMDFIVRREHLDHNGHVNNIKYADFIFDAQSSDDGLLKSGTIEFVSEISLGQTVSISKENLEGVTVFTGKKDGTVAFNAEYVFE